MSRFSSRARARAIALLLAVAVAAPGVTLVARAEPTAAEFSSARELFKQGTKLRQAGDLPGALEKFRAADALVQTAITGLELAKTEAALGQLVEARELCLVLPRRPVQKDETQASVDARAEATRMAEVLLARIPTVVIRVEHFPSDGSAHVTLDGTDIPAAAFGVPLKVNPGRHAIVATAAGATTESRVDVELEDGGTRDVTLAVPSAGPVAGGPSARTLRSSGGFSPPAPPPTGERSSPLSPPQHPMNSRPDAFVSIGIGITAAGVAVGTLTGLSALSRSSELSQNCPGNHCPPSAWDDLDSGKALGTVSTVAFGVAAVGVGILIYGVVRHKPDAVTPAVGRGSFGLQGSF